MRSPKPWSGASLAPFLRGNGRSHEGLSYLENARGTAIGRPNPRKLRVGSLSGFRAGAAGTQPLGSRASPRSSRARAIT